MRLFLCSLYFFISLSLGFPQGNAVFPIDEKLLSSGHGYISQDISTGEKRSHFYFFSLESLYIGGGSDWSIILYLPDTSLINHYKGEIIHCKLRVESKGKVRVDSIEYTGEYYHRIQNTRALILESIRDNFKSLGKGGALLESLVLGKKNGLNEEDALFRKAGVSHLLALSGLHRGIITLLIVILLRPFVPRNILGIMVVTILFAYTWLIGVKHSLIRAVIMYGFLMVTDLFKLKPSLIKILIISLLLQTCIWPESLHSLSLQLSYLAMAGIILLTNPFHYMLKRFMPGILAIPLSLSFSAQLALFPLLIRVFGVVQLWGIVAGVILTPLITLFIWSGMICLPFLYLFPILTSQVEIILAYQYELIMFIVSFFSCREPLRQEELFAQLLFIFSLSVMVIRVILSLIKEGSLVRKSIKTEL